MKKVFIILSLITAVNAVKAQEVNQDSIFIDKGDFLISGSFSTSSFKSEFEQLDIDETSETKSFSISFNPQVGYAVSKNSILGLRLGYGFSKFENSPDGLGFSGNKNNLYSIGPFFRRYFSLGSRFLFFVQGSANYLYVDSETYNNQNVIVSSANSNGIDVGARPGVTFFLNERLALESSFGNLGYNYQVTKRPDNEIRQQISGFSADFNLSTISLALSYYF